MAKDKPAQDWPRSKYLPQVVKKQQETGDFEALPPHMMAIVSRRERQRGREGGERREEVVFSVASSRGSGTRTIRQLKSTKQILYAAGMPGEIGRLDETCSGLLPSGEDEVMVMIVIPERQMLKKHRHQWHLGTGRID
jgi:hypothetical protein